MGSERLSKMVYMLEIGGERGRRRPPFRWLDEVRGSKGGVEEND